MNFTEGFVVIIIIALLVADTIQVFIKNKYKEK